MRMALIVSSFVAGSRVGGYAQALALAPFGIDPVLAPTVLFGRHPGWGPPGGGAVGAEALGGVLEGVEANGLYARMDAVITGYFASAEQVALAARAIDRVRAAAPGARVVVDAVMGDTPKGLYVREAVAEAVAAELVPRAGVLRCNLWELGRLTGTEIADAGAAVRAARTLGRPVVVSSMPAGTDRIGVAYVDAEQAWLAAHARGIGVPNGTGDLLTALWVAAELEGLAAESALVRAVGGVAEAVEAALATGASELPLVAPAERLRAPGQAVTLEVL